MAMNLKPYFKGNFGLKVYSRTLFPARISTIRLAEGEGLIKQELAKITGEAVI